VKLNLKGWHKVSSDKTHTVMRDPKGHELKVCHSALSKGHRAALDKLPVQMAEGGLVSMAHGGVVERHFDGGVAGEEQASSLPQGMDEVEAIQMAASQVNPMEVELERRKQMLSQQMTPVLPGPQDRELAIEEAAIGQMTHNQEQARAKQMATLANEQQAAMAKRDQVASINAQRERLGLTPLPVPEAPTGQAAAANSVMQAAAPQSQPMAAQAPQMGMDSNPMSGIEMQKRGLAMQAESLQNQAARDVQAIDSDAARAAKDQATFQENFNKLEAERQTLIRGLEEGKIDPRRVWNDMNVGSKIATGIGMILGGIGGGMLHQENPVMKMLNQQMEHDLQAQKTELGKKETLLSANMRQFGNVKDAMEMTRIQQRDTLLNQLKKSASLAQGPQAKAMLMQEIGKLQQAQDMSSAKFATERTINQIANQDPNRVPQLIEQLRMVDPKRAGELQAQYVPGMGLALTENDAKELKGAKAATDSTINGIRQLQALISRPGKTMSPAAIAEAEVIMGQLTGPMRTALGLGVMNKSDFELLERMIANPTKLMSLDSSNRVRLQTLTKRIRDGLATAASARGITNYDPANSLSPEQKRYADWARSNPQDPRAAQVLQKLGL
jgi:hypothetical protein